MVAISVFFASAALIIYVLFGYPAVLMLLSRLQQKPVHRAPIRPTVSVLLPVRNGERWVGRKLESILALDYPAELLQVLVVSDGSIDRTEAIVEEFASDRVRLLLASGGKAAALNVAMEQARGDILFFTDVRQPLDPKCLTKLVEAFSDPSVGVVSGGLTILEGESREEADVGLYWRYEKWMRKKLSDIDSVLGATGCIYAVRRELAVPLPAGTLLDDVYQPLAAFFRGYRVLLDDSAKAFDFPTSLDSEFGRKVRTLAGVYQIIGFYPRLLGPANRMWIHFMSHKVGRLVLPYALIAMFASAFWLPAPWAVIAVGAQILFYALTALDLVIPDSVPLKRLSSPARTFIVLVSAAFVAPFALFFFPDRLWKTTQVGAKPAV
jgi:poly-beta-1,6-N-acetyl-D-glucosamine synthase